MARRSKVEVSGWSARHYDVLMDILLLGTYHRFIVNVINRMKIQRGDNILDLGSGTGRNVSLMIKAVGRTGRIVGVDIGPEMLVQARRRCRPYPQVTFLRGRIEQPLDVRGGFHSACLFFVLHGFENEDKEQIIANAYKVLRPGGMLWILDYAPFVLENLWLPLRWAFTHFECGLAVEFLKLDLREMLARGGFGDFVSFRFVGGVLRLLGARTLKLRLHPDKASAAA